MERNPSLKNNMDRGTQFGLLLHRDFPELNLLSKFSEDWVKHVTNIECMCLPNLGMLCTRCVHIVEYRHHVRRLQNK